MKFEVPDVSVIDAYGRYSDITYSNCMIKRGSVRDYSVDPSVQIGVGYAVLRSDNIGRLFEIDSTDTDKNQFHRAKRQAELYAQLWTQFDHLYTETDGAIPISVATEGKPAIAAYLFAVEEQPPDEIGNQIEVSEDTVWKYLRRFRDDENFEEISDDEE